MNAPALSDYHLHTSFSADSQASMEDMIRSGIEKGVSYLCFTEHMDIDFPKQYQMDFTVDMKAYRRAYERCREKFAGQINLLWGIELGIQPHLTQELKDYVNQYPFDFVIGSSHIIHRMDPYYPEFWKGRSKSEAIADYFTATLDNLEAFCDIDVYGHIDYVVRYAPEKNKDYSYQAYRELLDLLLTKLIDKGIGIELNTGGFKYGLGHPNPCEEILARYRELGGEIITLGSDAHMPQYVAYAFPQAMEILKACGFTHYTIFRERKPQFVSLE
ncbi:MAG: histidinol-phosphatase HisJ family protein [Blautia sp.]|jgi:histidinol-phosphatase (PHP family)